MAIPKAYQAQMKTDAMPSQASKAVHDHTHLSPKMLPPKSHKLINLHKKRRYLWFGLIYTMFFCFIKCSGVIEKWENNAYNIQFFGVSLSVGKKAAASQEKPGSEKTALEKPLNDATKSALEQKDKLNTNPAGSEIPGIGKPVAGSAPKTNDVVTLETDGVGFDPLSTSSPKEVELLLKLAARRQDIEKREALLKERELSVSVAEKQIKDKIIELTKLKENIEMLLKKTDKNSQEQFGNLVKIYEGMKPKNAAQVFDRIDISVLKELVPLMSQRKVSSILDQMGVVKAKELSLVLIGNKNLFAKSAGTAPKK